MPRRGGKGEKVGERRGGGRGGEGKREERGRWKRGERQKMDTLRGYTKMPTERVSIHHMCLL